MRRHHLVFAVGVLFLFTAAMFFFSAKPALGAVFCSLSVVWFALAARKRKAAPPSDPPG